jgi:hypothetical protein
MLRFEPDIRHGRLHLAPAVPDWVGLLRLERIPLMGAELTLEVRGEHVHAPELPDGLTIVHTPRLPTQH